MNDLENFDIQVFKNLISEVAFETMQNFATDFKHLSSSSSFAVDYTNLDDLDSDYGRSTLLNKGDAAFGLVGVFE